MGAALNQNLQKSVNQLENRMTQGPKIQTCPHQNQK